MLLKPLLWVPLALASATSPAQPIDQPLSSTQTIDSTVRTEFDNILAAQFQDLNDDGFPDLIWTVYNKIYQAHGDGEGGFDAPAALYIDDNSPHYISNNSLYTITSPTLDLNQDGIWDFVSMQSTSLATPELSRVTFFVSNSSQSSMEAYTFPEVALTNSDYHLQDYVDINADGRAELVTLGGIYSGADYDASIKTFDVALNSNGIPTSVTPQSEHTFNFAAGTSAFYLKMADINGDDKLDAVFLVENNTDSTSINGYNKTYADLVVYYQEDSLTWSAPRTIKNDLIISQNTDLQYLISDIDIEIADLDNNGHKDIVTIDSGLVDGSTMSVIKYANLILFWQESNSNFTEQLFSTNYFWETDGRDLIKIHDIDSDGVKDIAFVGSVFDSSVPLITDRYSWYRNLNNRQFSDIYFLSPADDGWYQPKLSFFNDLNSDQQTDILMSGFIGTDLDTGAQVAGLFYINPDIYPPKITLSPSRTTHLYGEFDITLNANEVVAGLTQDDLHISGATISNWQETTPGLSYRFTATPVTEEASVVVTIPVNSFNDAGNMENPVAHTLTVNANVRPQISSPANIEIKAGETLGITPVVTDPDSTDLTYALINAPLWLSINTSTGELSGTPTSNDIDQYVGIRISVSDGSVLNGETAVVSEPFSINVTVNNPDADGDGIADELEDGDYNGDGINDNLQTDPGIESGIGGGSLTPLMLLLLLPLTLISNASRAESFFKQLDFKNTYAGIIAGKSYLTPDDGNSGWQKQNQWDSALGINLGYQFHTDGFVEINYLKAGEVTFANRNPNIPGEPGLNYSTLSLLGGYYLNQHNQYRGYVRTGISQLKTDSSNSLNNDQQSNLVVPFGAGIELVMEPSWNLRVGADYYSEDVQNLYLNLMYQH